MEPTNKPPGDPAVGCTDWLADDELKHGNMVRLLDDGRIELAVWENGNMSSSFLDAQDALSLSMRLIEALPVDRDRNLYNCVTEAIARKRAALLMQSPMPNRLCNLSIRKLFVRLNAIYRAALSAFKFACVSLWGIAHIGICGLATSANDKLSDGGHHKSPKK